jgi:PEP-CTERM motif
MDRVDTQPDIERAIRRSRTARAAQQRRRRRAAALMAVFAVSLTGGGIWTIGALTGNDMVEAAVSKAQSLADLLRQRSPGARSEGQLTKTKHARVLARQRLAPKPHHGPAAPPAKLDVADLAQLLAAPPLVPAAIDLEQPAVVAELSGPPPSLGAIVIPGPGLGGPPGQSPSPRSPGPESKQPVTVPSAVPEPGTWATMLLGFGLIGWRLRRSKRRSSRSRVPQTL